ncbi:MAG: ABC transporter permease, partial [Firmicutes bacterium]|nr:ABC transporter permease [Bacillota bacterium]
EVGMLLRTVRTSMLGALHEDFMDMAKVKGLPRGMIYFKYALRSALIAPLNVFGLQFAKLVGGTAVVESVFSLPGIGRLVLVAVEQRDIVLLQGMVMFITLFVIIISLGVDIAIMFINPRIRVEAQGE